MNLPMVALYEMQELWVRGDPYAPRIFFTCPAWGCEAQFEAYDGWVGGFDKHLRSHWCAQ